MWIGGNPEMLLFHCALSSPTSFTVSYHTPAVRLTPWKAAQDTILEIPFSPQMDQLHIEYIELRLMERHPAYVMPKEYNEWFTDCFGYEVVLAYLGDGVGIPKHDDKAQEWQTHLKATLPPTSPPITFSNEGALLVTSEVSVRSLDSRLSDGEKVVQEKFRPSIVLSGEDIEPWDEDFWAELEVVPSGIRILLTSNCARCVTINMDLDTGRVSEGESGKLLKKLQSDRRIDKGQKWVPIFGRYGFATRPGKISVGDEVVVKRRNDQYTTWGKFSLT
jgi:uncharacterized protein YcbX